MAAPRYTPPPSPATELATALIPELVAAELLRDTEADRNEAFQYLTNGTSRPEDWRRLLERVDEPPPKTPPPSSATSTANQADNKATPTPRPQPPSQIDWLEISYFRGIGQARWKLPLGGERLVVLTAENGVGKSTVLDALDMLCRRAPGSVAERFDGAEADELLRYLPHLGKQPADVLLRMQLKNGALWEGRLEEELDVAPAGSLSDEEDSIARSAGVGRLSIAITPPVKISQAATPHVRVLRRQRLLQLLEAHPRRQFEQIKSFVGLDVLKHAETQTESLCTFIEDEYKQTIDEVTEVSRQVVSLEIQRGVRQGKFPKSLLQPWPPQLPVGLEWYKDQLTSLRAKLEQSTLVEKGLEQLYFRAKYLTRILKSYRQNHINGVLTKVTYTAKAYFSIIHPNEDLGPISWQVGDIDQLETQAYYSGHHNITPQAYFSESHLDTLGFCYWLALARHAAPDGQAILLLDDVFTSADAPHLRRVTELLASEVKAKRFLQVIITTHNPLWETFFKRGGANARALRLYATAPDNAGGSKVGVVPNRTYAADVRAELDERPFDPVTAAAKAGILLERLYDEVALLYAVNLPRKATGYTLSDFGPVRSKLATLTIQRTTPDPKNLTPKTLAQACDELNRTDFIRNAKGAHYNPLGEIMAEEEARSFAEAVLTLADLLRCPHCGKAPAESDGRQFSCGCLTPTYLWPMPTR